MDDEENKFHLFMMKTIEANEAEKRKFGDIAINLKLPYTFSNGGTMPMISIKDLWEVLSDEEKLKELLARVRLKSFW
jgi:hypothetical protein